ncbi:hypothetical protein GCM10025858_01430 [Alicyclobacillus sacchari]|nr:hypothetical protein GCM10025858_01430 [Alicyclobacillus sacchari]
MAERYLDYHNEGTGEGEAMENVLHFIDGKFCASENGRTFDNINPATGDKIGVVAEGGRAEIDRAVAAARRAFKTWGKTPAAERAAIMHRIANLIEENLEELALLETMDTGKPLSLAKSLDIPRSAYNFRFFADFVKGMSTETFEMEGVALNYALRHGRRCRLDLAVEPAAVSADVESGAVLGGWRHMCHQAS